MMLRVSLLMGVFLFSTVFGTTVEKDKERNEQMNKTNKQSHCFQVADPTDLKVECDGKNEPTCTYGDAIQIWQNTGRVGDGEFHVNTGREFNLI